jgi:ATP-dependent DNA ligase
MSSLESVLEEARKLPLNERRRLAARLLEESGSPGAIQFDERLEAMRDAAGDELFLDDLTATMEDFRHADRDEQPV